MERDESVTSAIANWGPRFTAQGVDPNDFTQVTKPVQQWAEWLDAWCANADMHAGLARNAEQQGHTRTAGFAWLHAALSYHFAKFVWMLDMDRHRRAADASVAALRAAHRHLDPTAERIEVGYEDGTIYGNLRRPAAAARPPLVLLIAGLDSTKEEFFHVEELFLRRGMATFSFDGPGQGESGYTTRIRPDYEVAVSAVLDRLCERDDLDGQRIGALGVSLGGYYVVRAAAFEPRLRAAVACGGGYDYGEVIGNRPPNSRATFAHNSGTTGGDDTVAFVGQMNLAGVADKVRQPLLVVFGKQDRLVPWQHAQRVAQEAPDARLWMFDEGNHVCMNMVYKWRPQAADWLGEQLGVTS